MMLLAALVSSLVFRRISRPLDQLKAAADTYARGELGARAPVSDIVELGAVADAMNRMAAQLDERINTIISQRNEQAAVLRSMVEGVVAVDARERVLNLNKTAAAFFGVDQNWARGRSIQEVVRNVDLHLFARRALESEEPVEAEIILEGSQERFLRAHGSVLRAASGERTGAVLVLNDATRLRKLEDIRRDFVANVSHELKTPITSIRGFVETLLDGAMDNREDTERFLQIIDRQAMRLHAIVEDLLSLSRIEKESERDEIELTVQPLQPLLQNAVVSCEVRAGERKVKIDLACEDSLRVVANGRHLEQAVINLIDNAVKYSPDGSLVQVNGSRRDRQVVIAVVDRGCGIEARHLPRVFERFYRVDKARSREVGGTGLGLAIVKHIALAHNGSVHVESSLGKGSTFEIRLPSPA
jgi:two-component system phosphate regulon sensor histidine kinase PhoR